MPGLLTNNSLKRVIGEETMAFRTYARQHEGYNINAVAVIALAETPSNRNKRASESSHARFPTILKADLQFKNINRFCWSIRRRQPAVITARFNPSLFEDLAP